MRKAERLFRTLAITMVFLCAACMRESGSRWAPDVGKAIDDFIAANAGKGKYVVFDFDNTTCIFDIEETGRFHQLSTMSFAMTPGKMEEVLSTGLENWDEGKYADWITDIVSAYGHLWDRYGPFTPDGIDDSMMERVHADAYWQEFATKLAMMYSHVAAYESSSAYLVWYLHWFHGMHPRQMYSLMRRSHAYFSSIPTESRTWTSPEGVESRLGRVVLEWKAGLSVTDDVRELWRRLHEADIDIWVCSASGMDHVTAAVDEFGLHEYCTGVMAMTMNRAEDGTYECGYGYDESYAMVAIPGGGWIRDVRMTGSITFDSGKVRSIENVLVPRYGCGPSAGFGDSTGDFNFLTEFSSLQIVVCFNRGDRRVTDGGGLIAEVALYEAGVLGYDYSKAVSAGDTLYLLQGRDENGYRMLVPDSRSLRHGEREPGLLADGDNYSQLEYFTMNGLSVRQIFDRFSIRTSADDGGNTLGFEYGFLDSYAGYHSR